MTWYKAGTVAVTQGSNAVIGTGTSFIANSRVGDGFRGPDGGWYEITNIASDTAMAISPPYGDSSAYSIAPLQGYLKDSADALRTATKTIAGGIADMEAHVATATEAAESAGQSKTVAIEQAEIARGAAITSTDNKDTSQLAAQQSQASAQESGAAAVRSETAMDSVIQSERAAAASASAAAESAEQAEAVTVGKAASGNNNDITSLRGLTADGFDRILQGLASMVGATASAAGKQGLVPPGAAGDQDKFLTAGGVYKEAGGAGLPVGSLVPWSVSRATLPAGWIARDGQLLNRADWPDLWALVSTSAVTDAVWLASPYTSRGKYSSGDGSSTFRIPDDNAKHADGNTISAMVLRGDGKNSAGTPGLHQADQMQGHKHRTPAGDSVGGSAWSNLDGIESSVTPTAVFATNSTTLVRTLTGGATYTDGANGTPRIGSETRAANSTVIWCTVGAGKATNPGSVDVTALATTVSNQSSLIAVKLSVVSTGGTDLNGWAKYSDGTIKQWGVVSVSSAGTAGTVFSFNTPFITAVRSFGFTPNQSGRAGTAEANSTGRPESVSQFRIASGQSATPLNFNWWAEGV
ncbi:phage tail protein [Pseudomonas marginalis]